MGKKKYNEVDAAIDTNVSKKEVSQAWHQARNDAERSGEILDKRELSEKADISIKNESELQKISMNDKEPSQEQLNKWREDQMKGVNYYDSIQIAERIKNEEGEDFFKKASKGENSEIVSKIQSQVEEEQSSQLQSGKVENKVVGSPSKIQSQVTEKQKRTGQIASEEHSLPQSKSVDKTQSPQEGQKR